MHDITDCESRGLPAVMVASTRFERAAGVQGAALGFEPAAVFVRHPIQDRTDEEMQEMADAAVEGIVAALTQPPAAPATP